MSFVTEQQIYSATNGGLDVILRLYPQAAGCETSRKKKFKIRPGEKTASANLYCKDGVWLVTDFGGDQKSRNAILSVMHQENIDYPAAIRWIANQFNLVPVDEQTDVVRATFAQRPAKEDEPEGHYSFDVKEAMDEFELRTLFAPKVIEWVTHTHKEKWAQALNEVCKRYGFFALRSFTRVKDRKATTIGSTGQFPIYLVQGDGFAKVYQPKSGDKQYRFQWFGEKPKDHIFGLKRLNKAYQDLQPNMEEMDADDDIPRSRKPKKLTDVVLCSGEGDSINVAALGYNVIWQNSETATLSGTVVSSLRNMCENVYNVPDIDATGISAGHKLALTYLDIKTVWLPDELRSQKDWRGNARKDVRDFFHHYTVKRFNNLVATAMPYMFWNRESIMDKNGEWKKYNYEPNNLRLYNFLQRSGFWRFELPNEKEGYGYIYINQSVVEQIKYTKAREYVNNFLENRAIMQANGHVEIDENLRNKFYRTPQLSETSLSNLALKKIDFTDYDKQGQWIFFINNTWHITKTGIVEYAPESVQKMVWNTELINHRVKLIEQPPFTISVVKTADGGTDYNITLHNTDCAFLRFLINTSRIYWRREFEDNWTPDQEPQRQQYIEQNRFNIAGPRLTPEEQAEQKKHLVNKLFSLGYLLHRYKDPSRPWCVFAMDAKPAEEGESHGGSGKSIAYKAVRYFMNSVTLDGRNKNLTRNPHVYEMVNEHTDLIMIDDADQYLDFDFFFSPLTGDLVVNPKNNKQFIIPFEHVAKFVITSNYTLRKVDASTSRRILYSVFSDYYHYNTNSEYRESRSVHDDFGKSLFLDFTEAEWNLFFNTMAWACAFYLNVDGKIEPPLDNVERRNLETQMGDLFSNWVEVYFSPESERLDTMVSREQAFSDFVDNNNVKHYTPQRFIRALKAWCRLRKYVLNPVDFQNPDGRIIRKITVTDKTGTKEKTAEMIYIRTTDPAAPPKPTALATGDIVTGNNKEPLPF